MGHDVREALTCKKTDQASKGIVFERLESEVVENQGDHVKPKSEIAY